jgi:hypothetical protein
MLSKRYKSKPAAAAAAAAAAGKLKDADGDGGEKGPVISDAKMEASAIVDDQARPTRLKRTSKRNRMFEQVQTDMKRQQTRLKSKKMAQHQQQLLPKNKAAATAIDYEVVYVDRDRAAGVSLGTR